MDRALMISEEGRKQGSLIQLSKIDPTFIRRDISAGLLKLHPVVSPKYLYDSLGSRLFTAICELDEYYPTRTEAAIFEQYAEEIAQAAGSGTTLIDLGAGDCKKAERLMPCLQPIQYVPVDISADFLVDALQGLQCRFPHVDIIGLGMDFSSTLDLPESIRAGKRLFFYPGSSIGNFNPHEATAFLKRLRAACQTHKEADGGILVGVDLVKDESVLNAAYDDALGVTAAFNLNMLLHINRLLQANFNLRDWQHRAFFNKVESRIEMHLEAKSNVTVRWSGGERRFERGESIHTESSYKYSREKFLALLKQAGFGNVRTWTDPKEWFMVCYAQAI